MSRPALTISRGRVGEAECALVTRAAPSVRSGSIRMLVKKITEENQDAAVLYAVACDPTGYPRIVRDGYGDIKAVVEEAEATPEQLEIREIGASAFCFHRDLLLFAMDHLPCENGAGEYRICDVIAVIANMGGKIAGVLEEVCEGMGESAE